jgi:hypothetical protein
MHAPHLLFVEVCRGYFGDVSTGNNLSKRSGFNYPIAAEVIRIFVQYYVAKIVKQYFANSVSLVLLYAIFLDVFRRRSWTSIFGR